MNGDAVLPGGPGDSDVPKRLSNGICSLNPEVDRLTMTCDMEIDPEGNVVDYASSPA